MKVYFYLFNKIKEKYYCLTQKSITIEIFSRRWE